MNRNWKLVISSVMGKNILFVIFSLQIQFDSKNKVLCILNRQTKLLCKQDVLT